MQANFTFVCPEAKELVEKRLRALKPFPKRRRRFRPVNALNKNGQAVLSEASLPSTGNYIVRIYYQSMGGELLYCETAPLSCLAAENLRYSIGRDITVVINRSKASSTASSPRGRLVILPSQHSSPVERIS